ncbi:MAG: hypothetical protein HKM87_04645, partial [Ignavibacteriaceae bacterium]|nr:hypothetical protein [Ignavibacteriaceae bacterium]
LLSFLSAIYSVSHFKKYLEQKNKPNPFTLFKINMGFLLVPFLISVGNSFFAGFCSFYDGLLFYLVITAPSVIIGGAIAIIALNILSRFHILLVCLIYLGILSITFFELYYNPQVFFFNPIYGYFPGTIYDEGLSVSSKLFLYRCINIIFFGYILLFLRRQLKEKKRSNKKTIFVILFLSGVFYYFSPSLGFSTTYGRLNSELPVTLKTKNFIIHTDRAVPQEELKLIALNQEFYLQQLERFFEVKQKEKIHSFIFRNNNQKKNVFGSGNADVAKPWLNNIYLSIDSWEHTLKHELAHCVSAEFGSGIFKVAAGFNPALIEGIAEAADNSYDDNEIHFMAALAYNNNYKVNISSILTGLNFFSNTSSLGYIYSGSFIRYLINNYGIPKIKQYYTTNDFENTYGIQLEEILKNYYAFLDGFKLEDSEDKAHYYFGRRTIFSKVCPRYVSDRLQDGWEMFNGSNISGARSTFKEILDKSDNYSALIGLAFCFEKIDSLNSAINVISDKISLFEKTSYKYNLMLKLADLKAKSDKLNEAKALYFEIADKNPNSRLKYITDLRIKLSKEPENLVNYLTGSDYDKYFILGKLNSGKYYYYSFPVLINLSESLQENYNIFLDQFQKRIIVNDYNSSYGTFLLSKYMMKNFDFLLARKMAGLSMRFTKDANYLNILEENYKKTEWFYANSDSVFANMNIQY